MPHRLKRSERCLNYEKLYQGRPATPKWQGVPQPKRKHHVVRPARYWSTQSGSTLMSAGVKRNPNAAQAAYIAA
ncbi:MAG TPA: hypothetical protein DDX19_02220 [Rhodopirellula baltica]|nr:hypothetical protein [Rhodopirellula baltica]